MDILNKRFKSKEIVYSDENQHSSLLALFYKHVIQVNGQLNPN